MASKLSPAEGSMIILVEDWLHAEHDYQFSDVDTVDENDAKHLRASILMNDLPDLWNTFKQHRHERLYDEDSTKINQVKMTEKHIAVGQAVLKATASARSAYLWGAVAAGISIDHASEQSWVNLNAYKKDLSTGKRKLPGVELFGAAVSVSSAINKYAERPDAYGRPNAAFICMAGLAITALLEQDRIHKRELPAPQMPLGRLLQWNYDQARVNRRSRALL